MALYNGMTYNSTTRKERTDSCKAKGDGSPEAAKRCMKYRVTKMFFTKINGAHYIFVVFTKTKILYKKNL